MQRNILVTAKSQVLRAGIASLSMSSVAKAVQVATGSLTATLPIKQSYVPNYFAENEAAETFIVGRLRVSSGHTDGMLPEGLDLASIIDHARITM